jgi:hypothetical protein
LFPERPRIHFAPRRPEFVHGRLESLEFRDQVHQHGFSASAQANELHASAGAASNCPYLTQGPERGGVDPHDQFSPSAAIKQQRAINAAPVQAQVAKRPTKNAVGRKVSNLRAPAAVKPRTAPPIVVCFGAFRHVYNIVRRTTSLENCTLGALDAKPK